MKHISILSLAFLLIITAGTNCKKNNVESGLPPATQEGKNTCGFLVNGKVWLPRGDNGYPNLSCSYDETFMGGAFNINGYRYESDLRSTFAVSGRDIVGTGIYKLNMNFDRSTYFSIDPTNSTYCVYEWYDTIPNHNAFLTITKLDKVNRIVAGTFEFAHLKQGCHEVRITKGRFDMKF
jgi:hypothetical protein